jgi:hypothetical protein
MSIHLDVAGAAGKLGNLSVAADIDEVGLAGGQRDLHLLEAAALLLLCLLYQQLHNLRACR